MKALALRNRVAPGATGVLALRFWVFAIALGSFVRNLRAGYALKLDAAGVHVPGLEVVPWSAVRDARLRSYESSGKRWRQIVFDVVPGYSGRTPRHYERWLFGPVAGLFGRRDTIAIPVHLLAISADDLLAAARGFVASHNVRATRRADVEASVRERDRSGGRVP